MMCTAFRQLEELLRVKTTEAGVSGTKIAQSRANPVGARRQAGILASATLAQAVRALSLCWVGCLARVARLVSGAAQRSMSLDPSSDPLSGAVILHNQSALGTGSVEAWHRFNAK